MPSPSCLDRKKDSGWGWVVLAAVTLSQAILGGICLTGGLFYVFLRNAFNSSPFETSWLCALPVTLWFYSSPVGSLVTNKYGYRASAIIGGFIAATGMSLGFLAPNFGFLFFSYGTLTGIGFGINYTAGMTAANAYFDKYRTLATGLCTLGYNGGLVIYSVVILKLEETYGWRGTMLILGAVTLHMCFFGLLLAPVTPQVTSHPACENGSAILNEKENVTEGLTPATKRKKKKYVNLSVFRKSAFICFCLSNILVNLGQGIYILHLPSYSKELGFSRDHIGTVLTVYGITNVIGKLVYSAIGQHPRTDVTIVYATSLAFCGVCIGLTPVFITRAGMLTLASLVGFFYCVTGALLAAVIFRIVGFERFADGVGMSQPFKASGNLIGGPLAGFLYARTGDYSSSFYVGGLCMVVAGILMVPPILKHRRQERNQTVNKQYTVCETEVEELTDSTLEPDNVVIESKEDKEMLKNV